jgi:hypothetical protein
MIDKRENKTKEQGVSVVIPGYWALPASHRREIDQILKTLTKERNESAKEVLPSEQL